MGIEVVPEAHGDHLPSDPKLRALVELCSETTDGLTGCPRARGPGPVADVRRAVASQGALRLTLTDGDEVYVPGTSSGATLAVIAMRTWRRGSTLELPHQRSPDADGDS